MANVSLDFLNANKAELIDADEAKKFAILIPLIETEEGYDLLFEVRGSISQPGDICFPGGRMEIGEEPEAAAVREACEELLIAPEQIRPIGKIGIYHPREAEIIYPYVGYLTGYQGTFNKDEVTETFRIPLEKFLTAEPVVYEVPMKPVPPDEFPYDKIVNGKNYRWRKSVRKMMFYEIDGRVIWGLTARMLHALVRLIRKN